MQPDSLTPIPPDEVLYRQVHPNFLDGNHAQSPAFNPTPKDEGELSIDLSSLISAKDAYLLFTGKGYSSVGVWPIVMSKCSGANTSAYHKPSPGHKSHGFVDFRGKDRKECKRIAQ
ncbi:MAG TPA: hypothetical protein VE860_20415, partial [Chthoniobacterales bacterium]|nr:hypothetical protein [Chthoniobacterales bacterium]